MRSDRIKHLGIIWMLREGSNGQVTSAPLRQRSHQGFAQEGTRRVATFTCRRMGVPPPPPPPTVVTWAGTYRKSLKTAVKPLLKSLRSLSLAAQIDVKPCFTFNSIGQKTAIRWRGPSPIAGALCRRFALPRLITDPFGDQLACLPALVHSGPPARCKR